jgi:hypothetical protein
LDRTTFSLGAVLVWVLLQLSICSALYSQTPENVSTADISASVSTVPAELVPAPPDSVWATDTPDDNGGSIDVTWKLSPDEALHKVKAYVILRAPNVKGQPGAFVEIGQTPKGTGSFTDGNASTQTGYYSKLFHSTDTASFFYKVLAVNDSVFHAQVIWRAKSESMVAGPTTAVAQWFDTQRRNVLVGVIVLCILIMYYISQARRGKELFIRKIAGLEAVNEAVGRATEMGRKILFIPGSSDMDNVQTLAAITILGHVAGVSAQYDTALDVPVSRSLVMVACREVVKEAYTKAGRPDSFHEDQVHYLTDDQFGYAAAIDGIVVREKPATIFLLGNFYAEALILAETGNAAGAIQIAGTGEPSQLPFFVAACDYTLIGEELFAASAYLSKEPRQLGSLKGQDIGKGLLLIFILIGVLAATFHWYDFSRFFTVIH